MKYFLLLIISCSLSSSFGQILPEEIYKHWVLKDIVQDHGRSFNPENIMSLGTQQPFANSRSTMVYNFTKKKCIKSNYPWVSPYLDTTIEDRKNVTKKEYNYVLRNDSLLFEENMHFKILKLNATELVLMKDWFDPLTELTNKRYYYFHKRHSGKGSVINSFRNDWWHTWEQDIDLLLLEDTIKLYKDPPKGKELEKPTTFIIDYRLYTKAQLKITKINASPKTKDRFINICPGDQHYFIKLLINNEWVQYEVYSSKDQFRAKHPRERELWLVKVK